MNQHCINSQSSCECSDCLKRLLLNATSNKWNTGTPTNLFVKNCQHLPSCADNYVFNNTVLPNENKGYKYINPQAFSDKYSQNFIYSPVPCNTSSCNKKVYVTDDPRLISVAHGGAVLGLDRPPLTSSVKLNTLNTDKSLNNYGTGYKTYSDINAGDITYYINKSLQQPYYKPVFETPANVTSVLFRDPMGSYKPNYV